MDEHLIETLIEGEEVFRGRWLRVQRDQVRLPDGKPAMREYVRHPGACVVIPELRPGVFLARDLKAGPQQLDDGEFVELFEMSLAEAVTAVQDGRITDAKTITCLFWMQNLPA